MSQAKAGEAAQNEANRKATQAPLDPASAGTAKDRAATATAPHISR